jgi:hypothetical protein
MYHHLLQPFNPTRAEGLRGILGHKKSMHTLVFDDPSDKLSSHHKPRINTISRNPQGFLVKATKTGPCQEIQPRLIPPRLYIPRSNLYKKPPTTNKRRLWKSLVKRTNSTDVKGQGHKKWVRWIGLGQGVYEVEFAERE